MTSSKKILASREIGLSRRKQCSTLISPESGDAFATCLQTDTGKCLARKNRLHDVRGQRCQLKHSPNVAAVDTIRFGDVFQVLELARNIVPPTFLKLIENPLH